MKMKKILALLLAGVLLLSLVACGGEGEKTSGLSVSLPENNGRLIVGDADITENNYVHFRKYQYVLVPIIAVLEELGATVKWKSQAVATVTYQGSQYTLDTNKHTFMKKNGGDLFRVVGNSGLSETDIVFCRTEDDYIVNSAVLGQFKYRLGITFDIDYEERVLRIDLEGNENKKDEDDEFYMLSEMRMAKIAKNYFLTCSLYEFEEGDQVPFNKIFNYFTFDACYNFDEKMLEPTMLPYYNEDDFTFSVPHEIVDAYLVERFNTTPDPDSVEYYIPKTGCYDFDRHLGEFYYNMTIHGKRSVDDNKYRFEVILTHDIDSEAIPPEKLTFTVQLTRDGYKILAYSREEA